MFIIKNRQSLLYGLSLAGLLFLLKWIELRYVIIDHAFQIYTGLIAVIFTVLGIWLALNFSQRKTAATIIKEGNADDGKTDLSPLTSASNKPCLSKRELEVLKLMAQGLSNDEIAKSLFISLNTVKTHSSKLFEKMEVKRRTQAIDLAKKTGIIP